MAKSSPFRVIIAGGGIAGLTLANCLQKADIDYIVLESRGVIAPQVGASIGIFANGGRILDQLGVYDDILRQIEPTVWMQYWMSGKLISRKDAPQLMQARTGYPIAFGDRQMVLSVLCHALRNKSNVLVSKKVVSVGHSEEGVTVHCEDGTSYDGDVVVGADGVHSKIRHEMWRNGNIAAPQTFTEKEMGIMLSEYTCVYGISSTSDLTPGDIDIVHAKHLSAIFIAGKDRRTFWFFFIRMDKKYRVPDIPRWTKQDAEKQIEDHLGFKITDKVTLGDIWKTRLSYTLVSLEEADFKEWSWGRIVCLGDSAHKMTPNLGMGGNVAIESAAALANNLKRLLGNNGSSKPSAEEISEALQNYHMQRKIRAKKTLNISNMMTRVDSLKGLPETILALYIAPNAGDFLTDLSSDSSIGAEKLEYLPDPERSFLAAMPFNKNRGAGQEQSRIVRALIALPLLAIGWYCHAVMGAIAASPPLVSQLTASLTTGTLPFATAAKLSLSYYGPISFLDSIFRPIIGLFSPALLNADFPTRNHLLCFLTDLAPIYLIWILESHRRANVLAFARIPLAFGLAFQIFGIGSIGPLYYFLHYAQSPLSQYQAGDLRMHNIAYSKTALLAIILAYPIPTFAMFFAPVSTRLPWNALWQAFPLVVTLTHYLFATFTVTDTTRTDRLKALPVEDLRHIRIAVLSLIALSTMIFNYVRFSSTVSLASIFLPSTLNPTALIGLSQTLDLVQGLNLLAKVDHISCFIASFIWLALLFWDLKADGMVRSSWAKLISISAVGIFVAGPGAVIIAGWWVREEVLAFRPAKGAVVRPRV